MIELRTFYVEDRIRSIGLPAATPLAAAPLKKSRSYHEHSDAEHDEVHILLLIQYY